jgi:hypothetical protein
MTIDSAITLTLLINLCWVHTLRLRARVELEYVACNKLGYKSTKLMKCEAKRE